MQQQIQVPVPPAQTGLKGAICRVLQRPRLYRFRVRMWLKYHWPQWAYDHKRTLMAADIACRVVAVLLLGAVVDLYCLPRAALVEVPKAPDENCYSYLCFVPQSIGAGEKVFGFAELIGALALLVLVWTIADVRYRFRIAVAPGSLYRRSFTLVVFLGFATLLTDVWRSEEWWVPKSVGLNSGIWQFILGSLFFGTFVTWVWYAFIQPPIFGRRNALSFVRRLYIDILQGVPVDAPVIADELASSAKQIIRFATDHGEHKNVIDPSTDGQRSKDIRTLTARCADDLLLLIADKRFCQHLVEESPRTALAFFKAIADTKKYGVQIEAFGRNITNQALNDPNSFLYHEGAGYSSGLLGYVKPLTQAMYGNYRMVEAIGSLLDLDVFDRREQTAPQFEVYCRIVKLTFTSYVEGGFAGHSYALYRALGNIDSALGGTYALNGKEFGQWDSTVAEKLRTGVKFVNDCIEVLDKKPIREGVMLRNREPQRGVQATMYDHIAELMVKIIHYTSYVSEPQDVCWQIQAVSVWFEFFRTGRLRGPAMRLIHHKFRRLLYKEIAEMSRFPNFKGARFLSLCLNTMGLSVRDSERNEETVALQRAILSWVKKHFAALHIYNPSVATECLVDGFTYDPAFNQILRIYPAKGLRRTEYRTVLRLDPPELHAASRQWRP